MCRYSSVISGILATLTFVSSISAFVYFMFYGNNIHASAFVLICGIISICVLHLNVLYLKREIRDWYTADHLESIASFGLVASLLSMVVFGVYLSLGIVRHQSYTLKHFSYYIAAICSAISSIWAFVLFISALLYRREQVHYPLLLCRGRSYS